MKFICFIFGHKPTFLKDSSQLLFVSLFNYWAQINFCKRCNNVYLTGGKEK